MRCRACRPDATLALCPLLCTSAAAARATAAAPARTAMRARASARSPYATPYYPHDPPVHPASESPCSIAGVPPTRHPQAITYKQASVLTASGESDEASETDAGQTEAKRRRGGERTAAEEGEGASRARAVDAGVEESTQAGAEQQPSKRKKRKQKRGKGQAHQSYRMRATRRGDKGDAIPGVRDEHTTRY